MILHNNKGWVYTDPCYWPSHPEWESQKRKFAKSNLELLEECKLIHDVSGYFGWEDLPENERKKYEKRFATIVKNKVKNA